ncbi:MAG: family 10 glycosylhydrolase [Bacilli bacterium]|nr:family 10 glycosylhydrolase [Bacilli bacterium]
MKKIFVIFLIIILFFAGNAYVLSKKNNIRTMDINYSIKGVYISYIEYLDNFQNNSVSLNKAYILKMLDNIENLGFNSIFLHVSPFSDAIYNSSIMPSSYTITGVEGKNLGMDYLDYFIEEAHKRNIRIHAWINPYRVSSVADTEKLSNNNPALIFLNESENAVKITKTGIYYNPANPKVLDLLLRQVHELLINYDIDGIHLDDYFYPDSEIDLEEYNKYFLDNNVTLSDYRLNIINTTIKSIYKLIKDYNSNIIFSISPDGNIENNYEMYYADVKTWLSSDGYIDVIMPQVYYGFDNNLKPFDKTIDEWNNLITNDVHLVPVLAFYKVGLIDNYAGSGKYEWINNSNIITRQINYSKTLSHYNGFTLFRYDYLFNKNLINNNTKSEIENLKINLN